MLLAIDVGNTNTVLGVWSGDCWRAVWRRETDTEDTEDQLAVWLKGLFDLSGLPFHVEGAVVASVVPALNDAIARMGTKWLGVKPLFLTRGSQVGLDVRYDPPHAVGADRIANALAAVPRYGAPVIVVDFGTATTFDAVDSEGAYLGGAILPGPNVAASALHGRTSKLPMFELAAPERAIGRNTVEALQSGLILGYAGAIDALAGRIAAELGHDPAVVATGGLGALFADLCPTIGTYDPTLTLDGLVIAYERLAS